MVHFYNFWEFISHEARMGDFCGENDYLENIHSEMPLWILYCKCFNLTQELRSYLVSLISVLESLL